MSLLVVLILVAIGLIALAVAARLVFASTVKGAPELARARLFASEKLMRITSPIALSGRPDQVWRGEGGTLIPVEIKRRTGAVIFEADRVQLSAYGYLLRHHPNTRHLSVAPFGFVRIKPPGGSARLQRITLMSDAQIERLHRRAAILRRATINPVANPSQSLCGGCGHRRRCPAAAKR